MLAPIRTSFGIVWITTKRRLLESGIIENSSGVELGLGRGVRREQVRELDSRIDAPFDWLDIVGSSNMHAWKGPEEVYEIYQNSIVVDESIFISLAPLFTGSVTTVSLDPKTGTTRNGALFEVRAINRMSVLYFDVLYFNPLLHGIREFVSNKGELAVEMHATFESVTTIVDSGLQKIKYYGVGGKRSRGYGRMMIWNLENSPVEMPIKQKTIFNTNNKRPVVFISHSWKDKHVARRLAGDLQVEGMDVWLDEHKILVGESIHTKVEEGLHECDYLVLLLSRNSLTSTWVSEEINAVRSKEKHERKVILLPVEIEELTDDKIPILLADRKRAKLIPKYNDGLQEIIGAIWGLLSPSVRENNTT